MPFTLGQRQTLGPPAEAPFVPFPFEELAQGIRGTEQGKIPSIEPREIKKKEGLLNINSYGFDLPVNDQTYLDELSQQKEIDKGILTDKILSNPTDPTLQSEISKYRKLYSDEENYGNTAKILRNKSQVDEANKIILGRDLNSWDTLELQDEVFNYHADRLKGIVSNLDLTGALARTPHAKFDRFSEIDKAITGIKESESISTDDYLSLAKSNANVVTGPTGDILVTLDKSGVSNTRVIDAVDARINSKDFKDDLIRQVEYESKQASLLGNRFNKGVRIKEIVEDSIYKYARSKAVHIDISRSITELTEDKGEGLFDGSLLKSTIKTIGTFDAKIPEIKPVDRKLYDLSGKLNNDKINKLITTYTTAANAIRDAKYKDKESFREESRLRSEAEHLRNLTERTLELRKSHKVISDLYTSDLQFTEAVKKATNASNNYKYEAVVPHLQILSQTMWDLASTNPQIWGLKDESTGEFLESVDIPTEKKPAFSIDPTTSTGGFQVGEKFYSIQLPDPLVPVFNTVKNITEGIQVALNQDQIVEIQPFIDFGDEKAIKLGRVLENGKYEIKIEYDPKVGYIDAQSYLSTYIESLSGRVGKIGKEILKGAKL